MADELEPLTRPGWNSSFSGISPNLQIAWDSTSMGLFKECPRKYQLSILYGYQPREISHHLTFGLHYHAALERYDHARAGGADHEAATMVAVKYALNITWNHTLKRPWMSGDSYKNRFTLVRSIVWYLDEFGADDPLKTIILANGKPAVELSFRFDLSYKAHFTGETFMLCGHLDKLATFQEQAWIVDRKTTKSTIGSRFFEGFSPDNQFSTYKAGAKVAYHTPTAGLIVDGAQIAVTFSRFMRGIIPHTDDQLDEWYMDLGLYLGQAQTFAKVGYWPMNEKACGNYGGCQFRGICSKPKSIRPKWLEAGFTRRIWDPLIARGDV